MKTIDMKTWPRRTHYELFRSLVNPHYSLTANVDCTRLGREMKPRGVSMYTSMLWCVMKAANAVPALRTRFDGHGGVVEYPSVHPSPTLTMNNGEFGFFSCDYMPDYNEFHNHCRAVMAEARTKNQLVADLHGRDDWIFLTCLPWLTFTSLTHVNNGPDDHFPNMAWGKFFEQGGRWLVPVNVQVHHALVDGAHVGVFFDELQGALEGFEG